MNVPPPARRRLSIYQFAAWGIGLGAWITVTAWGIVHFASYTFVPAPSGQPVNAWPMDTGLQPRAKDGFTLLVALHPECPCSMATLQQVDQMLAFHPRDLQLRFVFVDEGEPIEGSDLWSYAGRIPGGSRFHDRDGAEARRFGFQTSGEARLYAPDGTLRFSGGLTVARGHSGSSPGCRAVLAAIADKGAPSIVTAPVFGCALFNESPAESKP